MTILNRQNPQRTALERAFELAASGRFAGVDLVRKQLRREGYDERQVVGRGLAQQLTAIIRTAKTKAGGNRNS